MKVWFTVSFYSLSFFCNYLAYSSFFHFAYEPGYNVEVGKRTGFKQAFYKVFYLIEELLEFAFECPSGYRKRFS